MNETIKMINNRTSLRKYSKTKISQEHVDAIINSALRAPTAMNMMLYSIIEVEDQAKKEKLVETCDNHKFIAEAPLVLLFVADMQRWYDYYSLYNVEKNCKENNINYRTPKESDLMMACCDALIAAQTAVIAAESLGIGSCYIGDIMQKCEVHQELFDLPKWAFPITLVCFGYYSDDYINRLSPRFDREYIHFKNTYKRLSPENFDQMYSGMQRFLQSKGKLENIDCANYLYPRLSNRQPCIEEERSVKLLIDKWVE